MAERRKYTSPLLYWVVERENIRKKKAAGLSPPWTDDPILQKYRFCNVRRIDDRVSQWLLWNVLNDQRKFNGKWEFIKFVALCRWVNWPPTIQGLMNAKLHKPLDLKAIGKFLDSQVALGKTYTGAYMVRAPSKKKYPGLGKGQFVAEVVVGALDEFRMPLLNVLKSNHTRSVWEVLCSVPNYGSFMAGQIVADLTYTPLLSQAYDLLTWAPQGPGSRRGFNRLLGRDLYAKITDEEWLYWLPIWREQVAKAIGYELNLHDQQNVLCEYDKYERVRLGQGRPRSTYQPETAF